MYKKIKLISMILAFVLFGSLCAIGCRPIERPLPERDRTDVNQQRTEDLARMETPAQETPQQGVEQQQERTKPQEPIVEEGESGLNYDNMPQNTPGANIEAAIEGMEGIENAVVILVEERAFIGIETEQDIEITNMRALQSEIAAHIREMVPDIQRVYITSDRDRVNRLKIYVEEFNYQRLPQQTIEELEGLF
ncbi:MAG: YhcN/YlaJ family sporulation lipoprotein [Thermotaleaceae bacterium]